MAVGKTWGGNLRKSCLLSRFGHWRDHGGVGGRCPPWIGIHLCVLSPELWAMI